MRLPMLGIAMLAWAGAFGCGESRAGAPAGVDLASLALPNERAQLRASYVAARQAEAARDERYRVALSTASARGEPDKAFLSATNSAQGLELRFSAVGAEIAASGKPWRLGLRATEVICGATAHRLTSAQPASTPAANRINFERSANGARIAEWYVNGPLGLEQGFTVEKSPCDAATTMLGLAVELNGLSPSLEARVDEDGGAVDRIALHDADGSLVARYADLFAMDAQGRALASRLVVAGGAARLEVDVAGAAWPVTVDPLVWLEQNKLIASAPAITDSFGSSLALFGDTALVGAYRDDDNGVESGSVYVFVRSGATWTEQQKLTASDGSAQDWFGWSVALSGETALVGAMHDDAKGHQSGSAYVFTRSGAVWTEQQKLTASDGAAQNAFAYSVALEGETALVSGQGNESHRGAAYVFVRSGTTWTEQQKLVASDGVANDYFGGSVALSGNTALLGSYNDDSEGLDDNQGSAYVFVRSGTTWTEQQKLVASDGLANVWFGWSVALSGDTALVGASRDREDGTASGSAYVFARSGTTWTERQKLTASDATMYGYFGFGIALSGDTAVVSGARDPAYGYDSASAYVFVRSGDDWIEQEKLTTRAEVTGVEFESSIAISGATVLVGVARDPVVARGAAYVFGFGRANGDTCSADEQCASLRCIEGACRDIPQGEACSAGDICETGHCTDGVCCESACAGACEACANALTAEPDGTCAPTPADEDPDDDCPIDPDYPESCGADGVCDGQRACRAFAKAVTPCGATSCNDGVLTGALCDGAGSCNETSVSCSPYVCVAHACGPTKVDGADCAEGSECASGHCTDGVCCESACDAQCAACAEAGSEGECVAVTGAPRGDRTACNGDPTVCGGECDGVDATECTYPPTTKTCASECEADQQTLSSCDGAGECLAGMTESCGGYACEADTCLAFCKSDADCAAAFSCSSERQCVPEGSQCIEDDSNRCPPTPAASGDDGGCGCRLQRRSAAPSWLLLSLATLSVLFFRRRRPRAVWL